MTTPKEKDVWDKLQSITALLSGIAVPVLLFFLAHKADEFQKAASASALERENAARERELAQGEVSVRVAQASLIPQLIDGLLSADPQRRKLATNAILIALPEDGPRLVRELVIQSEDAQARSYAASALKSRKEELVSDLYAPDVETRKLAARALVQGWRQDPELAKQLVDYAQSNEDNENGVYNSVVVLGGLSKGALDANRPKVEKLLASAAAQGDKTAAQANRVKAKLNAAE